MSNFIVIVVCLLLGFCVRRAGGFDRSQVRPINTVILWMSLPALVMASLPEVFASRSIFSRDVVCLALMPWVVFAFTFLFVWAVGRFAKWNRATIGALALVAGLGNTSFVGYPLIEMFYGREALKLAILVDQPGSFLALSTVGILVASLFSMRPVSTRDALKRMLTFPPFLSVIAAILWSAFDLPRVGVLHDAFERLGLTLIPLALVSVGWQLDVEVVVLRRRWRELSIGLLSKLVLAPVISFLIFAFLLDRGTQEFRVLVLEAAMAPMITAAVVAGELELDGELAQLLVGIGIPLSFATVSIWWRLLV